MKDLERDLMPVTWSTAAGASAESLNGGTWTISVSHDYYELRLQPDFAGPAGYWVAASDTEAKDAVVRAGGLLLAAEWVWHRIELVPDRNGFVNHANGGRNLFGVEDDGSVVYAEAPDFGDFDPHDPVHWAANWEDGHCRLRTFSSAEAFVSEVFGEEYYLAAADQEIRQVARAVLDDDCFEGDIGAALRQAVAAVRGEQTVEKSAIAACTLRVGPPDR